MELVTKIFGGLFTIVLVVIILAYPTMLLWNYLMPDLFGFKALTFEQALALNILSALFFRK